MIFYFSNLNGTCPLIRKNRFQLLKLKYVAYQSTWGSHCKELIAESPFIFMADNYPAIPTEKNGSIICSYNRVPAIG
jgi:hypothetical protein